MELQELIIRFGLKVDDKALSNLNKIEAGFKGITDVATGLGKKFTGGKGIMDFFTGTIDKANEIKKFSAATGISEKSLQRWSAAAKATGADVNEIFGDLRTIKTYYGWSEKFTQNYIKQLGKMDATSRRTELNNRGLSDSFALLSVNEKIAAKAFNETPIMSDEDVDKATKARSSIENLKTSIENMASSVVLEAAPGVEEFVNRLQEIQKNNPEGTIKLIEFALGGLAVAGVTAVGSSIINGFANLLGVVKAAAGAYGLLATKAEAAAAAQKALGLSIPARLGLIAGAGTIATAGGNLIWKGMKNLYHQFMGDGQYEKNFIESGMDKLMKPMLDRLDPETVKKMSNFFLSPFMEKVPETNKGMQMTPITTTNNQNMQFTGATININTNEPIGDILAGTSSVIPDAILDNTDFQPISG